MGKFTSRISKIALIFIIHSVTSQAAYQMTYKRTPNLQIQFIFENETSPTQAALLQDLSLQALLKAEEILQIKLQNSVEIFFDSHAPEHNGLATLIPRDRILIQTRFPESYDTLRQSKDHIYETLVHEWSHILTSSQRSSFFKVLSKIVGNLATPNGLWPRWIHEGLAVWTESQIWGRAHSGVIDTDLKRAQEFYKRTGVDPLPNSLLDGGDLYENTNTRGNIPYHFGYLFWRDWQKLRASNSISNFIEKSSHSLGLSFRTTFQDTGSSLDKDYAVIKEKWLTISDSDFTLPQYLTLAESFRISGPFYHSRHRIWIEEDRARNQSLVYLTNGIRRTFPWPKRWGQAKHLGMTEEENKVDTLLVLSINASDEQWLHILNPTQKTFCQIAVPNMREFLVLPKKNNQIIWVEEAPNGISKLLRGEIDFQNSCQIKLQNTLHETHPYESLRDLSFDLNHSSILFSLGRNRNTVEEQRLSIPQLNLPCRAQISHAVRITESPQAPVLAQYSNPQYMGPILIQASKVKTLKLATASLQHQIFDGNIILIRQRLWEKDQILQVSLSEFQDSSLSLSPCSQDDTEPHLKSKQSFQFPEQEPYHVAKTLLPKFWIPSILAQEGSLFLSGQSFFSDIQNRYSGTIFAAASTPLDEYLFSFSLKTPSLFTHHESFHSRFILEAEPAPNLLSSQHQGFEAYHFEYESPRPLILHYKTSLGLRHLWKQSPQLPSTFHALTPQIEHSLGTFHSISQFEEPFRFSDLKTSLSLINRNIWIRAYQSVNRLTATASWSERLASYVNLDHAYNNPKNKLAHELSWGLSPGPSKFRTHFLNRAFSNKQAERPSLLRLHKSLSYNAFRPQWTLSWNRIRLSAIDLRLFFEQISYLPPKFHWPQNASDNFFSTIGAQTQFFGQTLGYVDYLLGFGVYQGFGNGSQTRFEIELKTKLDI